MRLVAHFMVFLLAAAALLNSVLVRVEVRRQDVVGPGRAETSGSLVIYKTPSAPGWPLLRQVRDGSRAPMSPDCPIGYCQDV